MNHGTPIGQLLSASLPDAKNLVLRRLPVSVMITLSTLMVAALVASLSHNLDLPAWISLPGILTISYLYYADAMRIVSDPHYKSGFTKFLRFVGTYCVVLGIVALVWGSVYAVTSRIPLSHSATYLLRQGTFYLLIFYFYTRFAFAALALKDHGVFGACGRSWVLTMGRTFWLLGLVQSGFYSAAAIGNAAIWLVRGQMDIWAWAAVKVGFNFAFVILVDALLWPFFARWMADREASTGTAPLVPPHGSTAHTS